MALALSTNLQLHDRAVFTARPTLGLAGKRKAEERDLGDRTQFDPGKSAVRRPIHRPSFTDDPSGLRICETNAQEVGQLGAGAQARKCPVDPFFPAVRGLKQGAGIADRPSRRRIGKRHVEQCDRILRFLSRPGAASILCCQDSPYRAARRTARWGSKLPRI